MSTQDVLDQAVSALGGREALDAAVTETITATGWRRHPGWGTEPHKPEAVAEFAFTLVDEIGGPRYKLSLSAQTHLVPTELDYTEIGNGSTGHVKGIDFMFDPRPVDMAIPAWRVATRVRHFDLTSPLRLVRAMLVPGADVEANGHILTLRQAGRPDTHVHVDPRTGLPVRVETVEEHTPLGDATVAVLFEDYRRSGTVVVPFEVTITVDDVPVHQETRSGITVASTVLDDEFAVPEAEPVEASAAQMAFSQFSAEWILTYVYSGVRFYFDLQTKPLSDGPLDIAPGVKIVIGPSHNTLVVEMPDHTLAVESPLYGDYTSEALKQVKEAFPGKPLTEFVGTHFHYDHIGGIREFASNGGLTVYVGEPTAAFFENIFTRPYTVHPDTYATKPEPVTVKPVTDPVILPTADGGTLQIHRITSDHSDDMMIVYLSTAKIVFESDLWNPTPSMPRSGDQRGRLATQLYQEIVRLGLDVETVVGGHSGPDQTHAAPLAYLKTAAGL
ncbi:MBL fold metallo-hydrolase [Kibdelosporangium philippinense]|uniref:MBL fold metallo-hydrolase n=1 Tax=Kibdelosporangium philippinense TaxID=211113 RepID=A0ABS8Z782_9PSEU|nr:MBL fold metallo-hydrolase [Kibdelosporangium philippinense]MCE7003741.1 MBL fold metallo-hydrolase [Kibdelosporangium philippinense]